MGPRKLLVTMGDTVAEIARERARHLLSAGAPAVLMLEIRNGPGRIIANLRDAADAAPRLLDAIVQGSRREG